MAKRGFYHKENGVLWHTWVDKDKVMQQAHGKKPIVLRHAWTEKDAHAALEREAERARRIETFSDRNAKTSIVWFGNRAND